MSSMALPVIVIALFLISALTILFDNQNFTNFCFSIVFLIGIGVSIWAGISASTDNEVKETQSLPIEEKTINGKTIQISYYQDGNTIKIYDISKIYGFTLDKDRYFLKRDIMKRGPYIGLYWNLQDKFTIIEKEKDK